MERSPSDLVRPLTTEGRADAAPPADATPKAGERRPLALADRSEQLIEDVREELHAVRAQLHSALERIRYQRVELAEARAQVEDERARYRELFEVAREGYIVTDLARAARQMAAKGKLATKVHAVPKQIEDEIAAVKLDTMGIKIDRLTQDQKEYLASWSEGT